MNSKNENSGLTTRKWTFLVSRVADGDEQAFGEIYLHFYNKLLRYGCIILPSLDTVTDAVQDLFVWILRNPGKIRCVENFEIYLFQSLKRNLQQAMKKQLRKSMAERTTFRQAQCDTRT